MSKTQARDLEIVTKYTNGSEIAALAEAYELSVTRIYQVLRGAGVVVRSKAPVDKGALIALAEQSKTMMDFYKQAPYTRARIRRELPEGERAYLKALIQKNAANG